MDLPTESSEEPTFIQKIRNLSEDASNICVIGVFGKGASGSQCKGLVLNRLLERNVFQIRNTFECVKPDDYAENSCYLEPYYDAAQHTLYLHLVSVYDEAHLAHLCRNLLPRASAADCHAYWKDHESRHARMVLFLFTVCHIMIVCHPKAAFDTSYVKLFKGLQTTREKLASQLSASLKGQSVSRQWQTSGRMCTPRLLFIYHKNDLSTTRVSEEKGRESKNKSPRKVFQIHLEDQIYRIFRKTHILTNSISHCLFSIPLNQAFVHIVNPEDELKNPIDELIKSCHYVGNHDDTGCLPQEDETFIMPITFDGLPSLNEKPKDSLRLFVRQHVDLILNKKGFDDNLRGTAISHFEFPTLKIWIDVATCSYELFMNLSDDPKVSSSLAYLQTVLDQDLRFSEMRCKKILPMASRSYQENSSSHYTSTVHRNKMLLAMKMYTQHARGPACETFARQLQEECERFWQSGHQLCEVISLTGHHCIHKLHLLPVDPELETPRDVVLSRIPHTNNNQTPCACNCGRSIGTREDPFDLKVANFDFFQELEEKCCKKLHHFSFPVCSPATPHHSSQMTSEDSSEGKEDEADYQEEVMVKTMDKPKFSADTKGSQSGVMTPELSLGQSVTNEGAILNEQPTTHTEGSTTLLSQEGEEVKSQANDDVAEYTGHRISRPLQGMLCNTSPRGIPPKFSSWSLICLGSSSLYNPSKGLDQPNFMRDSKHLLPWDIPIPKGSVLESHWPAPNEALTSTKKMGRGRDKKDASDVLRAYIGNEYECPRGHRFICSGPEKVVKVPPGSGGPKENGNKLVTCDMPLYFPCPCRANKPPLGQLIRSFVVTPPAPVHIKLSPRIRPGPHLTPVFYPITGEDGITLSSSTMWVLRYPFVYISEAGAVMPPTDNQPTPGAKLLKGLYLVTLDPPQT